MKSPMVSRGRLLANRPAAFTQLSITIPFEPKMTSRTFLSQYLFDVLAETREKLKACYPSSHANQLIRKLNTIFEKLDFHTYAKSVAILLSPDFEKVLYLNIKAEKHIYVDHSFNMRELVERKEELKNFLVLALKPERTRIYLGNDHEFKRIVSNVCDHMETFRTELSPDIIHFTNGSTLPESTLKKFLGYTDQALKIITHAYPFPLFVIGNEKMLSYFARITKNQHSIVEYIPKNLVNDSDLMIREAIKPRIADWDLVKQLHIFNRLEAAEKKGNLATGIQDVCREANRQKAKLLIVEKNYKSEGWQDRRVPLPRLNIELTPYYIQDKVDEIIEKVLQTGGDVEFVEEGMLTAYRQIALILYS